jgi:RNA polymerase sigma-70 factor, ECF subfamily
LTEQQQQRTDEQLMCAYQSGETAAFDALYKRHKGGLFRYCTRQLDGQSAIAHELYQEVWMRVIQSRERYQATAQFSTWLYHIAHNILIDHWRSQRPHDALDEYTEHLTSNEPGPEHVMAQQQSSASLQQALVKLPRDQLNTLLLKEEGQFSLEDIATITGTTRETVKSRLRYAMDKLHSSLIMSHSL